MLVAKEEDSLFSRYLSLLDQYADYAKQAGKTIRRSGPEAAIRMFSALGDSQRRDRIARLETENAIFGEMVSAGERLKDSPRMLWRLLRKTGHTPRSDIFDKIGDRDVVEIYGSDHRHIFQNLNFYDYVSFDLETIFCAAWHEATRRDRSVEGELYGMARRMFAGEIPETVDPGIPAHCFEELGTEKLYTVSIRIKTVSPLLTNGRVDACVLVNECEIIASAREQGPERRSVFAPSGL